MSGCSRNRRGRLSFTNGVHAAEVGYKLLYSFGKSERDIERYKEGKGVIKNFDGLLIKGLFCYQPVSIFGLTDQLEQLKANPLIVKAAPKIIAVSDGKSILAYDLREKDTYVIPKRMVAISPIISTRHLM